MHSLDRAMSLRDKLKKRTHKCCAQHTQKNNEHKMMCTTVENPRGLVFVWVVLSLGIWLAPLGNDIAHSHICPEKRAKPWHEAEHNPPLPPDVQYYSLAHTGQLTLSTNHAWTANLFEGWELAKTNYDKLNLVRYMPLSFVYTKDPAQHFVFSESSTSTTAPHCPKGSWLVDETFLNIIPSNAPKHKNAICASQITQKNQTTYYFTWFAQNKLWKIKLQAPSNAIQQRLIETYRILQLLHLATLTNTNSIKAHHKNHKPYPPSHADLLPPTLPRNPIRRYLGRIKGCAQKTSTTIIAQFFIDIDGKVATSKIVNANKTTQTEANCIHTILCSIKFPVQKTSQKITYPFKW